MKFIYFKTHSFYNLAFFMKAKLNSNSNSIREFNKNFLEIFTCKVNLLYIKI